MRACYDPTARPRVGVRHGTHDRADKDAEPGSVTPPRFRAARAQPRRPRGDDVTLIAAALPPLRLAQLPATLDLGAKGVADVCSGRGVVDDGTDAQSVQA